MSLDYKPKMVTAARAVNLAEPVAFGPKAQMVVRLLESWGSSTRTAVSLVARAYDITDAAFAEFEKRGDVVQRQAAS